MMPQGRPTEQEIENRKILDAAEAATNEMACIGRAGIRGSCGVTGCPKCDSTPSENN